MTDREACNELRARNQSLMAELCEKIQRCQMLEEALRLRDEDVRELGRKLDDMRVRLLEIDRRVGMARRMIDE